MRNTRIASYLNRAGNYEAVVTQTPRGYVVSIVDIDAESTLLDKAIFKTEDEAKAYALRCVTDPGDNDLPF